MSYRYFYDAHRLIQAGELVVDRAEFIEGGLPGASLRRIAVHFTDGSQTCTYQFQHPDGCVAKRHVREKFGVTP